MYKIVKEVPIKIVDTMMPINIYIVDSKDETFLIRKDWLNRYYTDLSYSKAEITFRI